MMRSTSTFCSACFIPLGQRISISLMCWFDPSPKCTRLSLEDAYPTAVVTSFHCDWPSSRRDVNLCSDPHAIAFGANEFQKDPMVCRFGRCCEISFTGTVQHGDDGVDVPIIVEVAKSNSAVGAASWKSGPAVRLRPRTSRCPDYGTLNSVLDIVGSGTNPLMLSSTLDRATNRSFQPSLSKSKMPLPHPDISSVDCSPLV